MIRPILLSCAFALLASCQMVDQPQVTTREERIVLGMTVINDCERSECGRLNLDSQLVEDYSVAARMTHVTAFMASYSDFNDLTDIAPMTQLREVHVGATQIDDLSGLENFPNLTLLHIQDMQSLTDFSTVGKLSNLKELAIGGNDLGDMAFLRGLRNLTDLNLDRADVGSLETLRNHPALQRLDLNNTQLPDDISALTTIPNLREVSVAEWRLTDAQKVILDELRAKGVTVVIAPVMIVC